jgi:hypothetical protein
VAEISITGPSNVQKVTVTINVSTVAADLDLDGDVDQGDFGVLQACYAGTTQVLTGPCAPADLSGDNYITTADVPFLMSCMTGAGVYPDPACGQ